MAGKQHTHTDKCYRSVLTCARKEHTHVNRACYYQRGDNAGSLKCSTTEHTHGNGCYGPSGPFCGHN